MKKSTLALSLLVVSLLFISIAILVNPARAYALPTPNKIVNHDDISSVSSYMDDVNVRNAIGTEKWLFTHASVGYNMKLGMIALKNGNSKYVLGINNFSDVSSNITTSNGNIYEVNRGNPGIQSKLDIFTSAFSTYGWGSKVNIAMNKYCYVDILGLSGTETVSDMSTYAYQYINSVQALESAYPGVTFVYVTVPVPNYDVPGQVLIYAYNQIIRNYASTQGKYLYDIADIEAYDPSGNHQINSYSGNYYETIAGDYTTDNAHPNTSVGEQRVALGWYAMAISIAYNEGLVETEPSTVSVTGITLSPTTANMTVGDSRTITATISPTNATNKSVTWASSDSSVATVTNGVIKAVKAGSATITATTADGSKKATVSVTVTAASVSVTGISLSSTTASLAVGDSKAITATILPTNATNKNVTWASNDSSVATVTNGVIKAVKAGSATITATTADGSKKATVAVTVTASSVAVTGITLNPTTASLAVGDSKTITATILPTNATNKNVTWTSSDSSVATVTNGVIKALKVGSTTVTATTSDGSKKATMVVTVKSVNVTSVIINNKNVTKLEIDQTLKLEISVLPNNATNKNVTWKSINPNVATVDNTGLVTALSKGTVTIIVTTKDQNKTDKLTIEITEKAAPIETVNMEKVESTNLDVGTKLQLNTNLESGSTKPVYVWESSNKEIATVDQNGIVSGIKSGAVTITLKADNGKLLDSIKINIVKNNRGNQLLLIAILIGGLIALLVIIIKVFNKFLKKNQKITKDPDNKIEPDKKMTTDELMRIN